MTQRQAMIWTVIVAYLVYLFIILKSLGIPIESMLYFNLSRLCQTCAREFGLLGMDAEKAYFRALNKETLR